MKMNVIESDVDVKFVLHKDQCSNWCQSRVPDEAIDGCAWQTSHKLEPYFCCQFMAPVSGVTCVTYFSCHYLWIIHN